MRSLPSTKNVKGICVYCDGAGVDVAVSIAVVVQDIDDYWLGLAGGNYVVVGDGRKNVISENADIIDGDGTFFTAEAQEVEVEGGFCAGGNVADVYGDGAGTAGVDGGLRLRHAFPTGRYANANG